MASEMARTKASRVIRRPKVHERGVRFSSHDWTDVRRNRSPRPARCQRVRLHVIHVKELLCSESTGGTKVPSSLAD